MNEALHKILVGASVALIASVSPLAAQTEERKPLSVCSEARAESPRTVVASDNALQLILLATPGALQTFSLNPLRNLWSAETGGEILGAFPAGSSEILVLTRNTDSFAVQIISAASGLVRRVKLFPRTGTFAARLISSDRLLRAGTYGLTMEDPAESGTVLWTVPIAPDALSGLVANAARIAIPLANRIEILDSRSGRKIVTLRDADRVLAFDGRDAIIVSVKGSRIASVDPTGRVRWTYRTGGRIAGGTFAKDSIIAASADNFVYRIDARSGALIWKARLPDRALEAPAVWGRSLFIVNSLRNSVEIRDIGNGRLQNSFQFPDGRPISGIFPLGEARFLAATPTALYEVGETCGE